MGVLNGSMKALSAAEVKAPYLVVAHSLADIEKLTSGDDSIESRIDPACPPGKFYVMANDQATGDI